MRNAIFLLAAHILIVSAAAYDKPPMPADCTELYTVKEFLDAGGTQEKRPVRKQDAVYPPEQKAAGVEGDVELEGIIGGEGEVIDVRILRATNESFAKAAAEAALGWVYYKPRVSGRPVCLIVPMNFEFRLSAP
jgi:TonB family protein